MTTKTLTAAILIIFSAICANAQDQNEDQGFTAGEFQNQGSFTVGYRFTDINGYKPKFDEMFGLQNGFRLLDVNLSGNRKSGKSGLADRYSFAVNGMGGDPYFTSQFNLYKNNAYDLRVNLRRSRYYWDRNDQAVLPSGLHGLTSNHDWATVRKFGSVDFTSHVTDNLKFNFEYYRNQRDGLNISTRSLEYFGASSVWGSFARANPYPVVNNLNEEANRVTGGIDYTMGDVNRWSLHYRLGYQSFRSTPMGVNLSSLERSINIDDVTTAKEPVSNISWTESRQLSTPVSEFSYDGRVSSKLDLRGGYTFFRYSGPTSLDMSFSGIARTNNGATAVAPYDINARVHGNATEPNHVVDQGFTYKASDWADVEVDYRYSKFTVDSRSEFNSVTNSVVASGESFNQWRIATHTFNLDLVFTPVDSLLLKTGVRFLENDVLMLEEGEVDSTRTKKIKTIWPTISAYYKPVKTLTLRGDIDQMTTRPSYTRVTPHTDVGGRFVIKFNPTQAFSIENSGVIRNRTLLEADYRSTTRSNASTVGYDLGKIGILGGFSYESLMASDFVNFLRGTAPITNITLKDNTINRIWQTGLRLTPSDKIEFNLMGNYVRTTGFGEIAGELPNYGPMSFPYFTGSFSYEFPRVGRLVVQLQQMSYTEEIVIANNFRARLLTVGWNRSF